MLPATRDRVPRNTAEKINQRIRRHAWRNIEQAARGGPEAIDRRLAELDREWDIERMLEANAASLVVASSVLGILTRQRRYFGLPVVVGGFLLQHALQGWCPPLPLFRRFGVRTSEEIDDERQVLALLAAGGDIADLGESEWDVEWDLEAERRV